MAPKSRGGGSSLSRRAAVALIGGGGLLGLSGTGAFTQVDSERPFEVSTATGANAIVGIVSQGDVQKNTREAMVQFINNHSAEITVTVTLDYPSDGELYDNEGGSGASVSFDLPPDNKQFVDINAVIQGEISYSVSVTSANLDLDTNRSVEAVGSGGSGGEGGCILGEDNNKGELKFDKLQNFQAKQGPNRWDIKQVQVQHADDDKDLNKLKFEIIDDSSETVRATETISISGHQYKTNLKIYPDDTSYNIPNGETYKLTITVCDFDGNSKTKTRKSTA